MGKSVAVKLEAVRRTQCSAAWSKEENREASIGKSAPVPPP